MSHIEHDDARSFDRKEIEAWLVHARQVAPHYVFLTHVSICLKEIDRLQAKIEDLKDTLVYLTLEKERLTNEYQRGVQAAAMAVVSAAAHFELDANPFLDAIRLAGKEQEDA